MLKKRNEINILFTKGNKQIFYCINLYSHIQNKEENEIKIFISVPKKKIPKANKRNLIKRRIKENIRLYINDVKTTCKDKKICLYLGFVYNKSYIEDFSTIKETINTTFIKIKQELNNEN